MDHPTRAIVPCATGMLSICFPQTAERKTRKLPNGKHANCRTKNTFGFFFEALAIRDLRVYAETLSGNVGHYLDANGLECDAVIHLPNGDYALVEIKLGGDALIAKGVASLNALEGKLDIKTMQPPAFKLVLTAIGEYAYRRKEDGVIICPISALRP